MARTGLKQTRARPRGVPFKKGRKKTGGRQKGTINKASGLIVEVRRLLQRWSKDHNTVVREYCAPELRRLLGRRKARR